MKSIKCITLLTLILLVGTVMFGCRTANDETAFTTTSQQIPTEKSTYPDPASYVLPTPDSIIVGANSVTKTVSPDDEEFPLLLAKINGRFPETTGRLLVTIGASRKTGDDGNIISVADDLRTGETFVEYIYDDMQSVNLESAKPESEAGFNRVLFPLTGEYNDIFAVGTDEDYMVNKNNSSAVFGTLIQDTELVTQITQYVTK